jgi:hypothetical protein
MKLPIAKTKNQEFVAQNELLKLCETLLSNSIEISHIEFTEEAGGHDIHLTSGMPGRFSLYPRQGTTMILTVPKSAVPKTSAYKGDDIAGPIIETFKEIGVKSASLIVESPFSEGRARLRYTYLMIDGGCVFGPEGETKSFRFEEVYNN